MKQKPDGEVVDVTPEEDESEEDWKREEARQAAESKKGEQSSIPSEDPPKKKNDYDDRPPPKSLKVSKQRGNVLFAKLMNIPGYTKKDKDGVLRDMGLKSVYDALDSDFEKHKEHLNMFYPEKDRK